MHGFANKEKLFIYLKEVYLLQFLSLKKKKKTAHYNKGNANW